jgi:formylglycine-generating enzyme required for sulfatase activity
MTRCFAASCGTRVPRVVLNPCPLVPRSHGFRRRNPWHPVLLLMLAASGLSCGRSGLKTPAAAKPATVKTKGGLEMVLVPGGSFAMGRPGKGRESPVHKVAVDPFLMDKFEVTQEEYQRYDLPNPSHFKGPSLPVEQVTWVQAAIYCNARSKAEGLTPCYNEDSVACDFQASGYRLPTEAEWEYACRAGSVADYDFGGDPRSLGSHAWFAENAAKKTHPVGQKQPNSWGLCDMHGNVAEWCDDVYDAWYYATSPAANPRGPAEGEQYVLRGGSWASTADALRSSARVGENPGFSDACLARDAIGFRCVRKQPPPDPPPATTAR